MFRAEIHQLIYGVLLKMEGRLAGQWAEEARSLFTKGSVPKRLIVDLSEVSYVDSAGEEVLNWFHSIGAEFTAKSIYAASICERLGLPLKRKLIGSSPEGFRGSFFISSFEKTRTT